MPINFINETIEIISDLKNTDDYAGAEKVIINKIKKHLLNRVDTTVIERHLTRLLKYFEGQVSLAHCDGDYIKYMYVTAVINTLLQTNYWHGLIIQSATGSKKQNER